MAERLSGYVDVFGELNVPANLQGNAFVISYKKMFLADGIFHGIECDGIFWMAGVARFSDVNVSSGSLRERLCSGKIREGAVTFMANPGE